MKRSSVLQSLQFSLLIFVVLLAAPQLASAQYLGNKVTALQAIHLYGKNHLFGIGPDVTMAVFQKGATIGLVNVRYLWESAGQSTFQGSTFLIGFTIARPKH